MGRQGPLTSLPLIWQDTQGHKWWVYRIGKDGVARSCFGLCPLPCGILSHEGWLQFEPQQVLHGVLYHICLDPRPSPACLGDPTMCYQEHMVPDNIAPRFNETHKPVHHDKVMAPGEEDRTKWLISEREMSVHKLLVLPQYLIPFLNLADNI